MRHRKTRLKLSRTGEHRRAMFRNMVTSLFEHNQVKTTTPKAKELKRLADKVITLVKKGDLSARRNVLSYIRDKEIVHKLFEESNERFMHTDSGYTRIFKVGLRKGDAAPMSLVILSEGKKETKKVKPKKDEKFIKEKELDSVALEDKENVQEEVEAKEEAKEADVVEGSDDKNDEIKAEESEAKDDQSDVDKEDDAKDEEKENLEETEKK